MQLFYNPDIHASQSEVTFDREESKHIVKVLRKKIDDILYITNGRGDLFLVQVIDPNINKCSTKIISKEKKPQRSYHVHLAVAPTKMNDRFEWFLEKATEIGIDEISPIICDHSERKVIKEERFERILQSAMKQSLQTYLPKLNKVQSFSEFMAKDVKGQRFIAHCEETQKKTFKQVLEKDKDLVLLIGPEGDFSANEIQLALEQEYLPVSLGETRLRTETAAIVGVHTVALLNE
ncbi:16S rRNA (uracil(1498)-N(3))-methyltransferase [Aquimarina brevivitae]|uniref:Ribosomal RNA small subunit methyltransferase E n=1 Tax=Aquimarina brevivitae TaxID=323412 RepID=A0A4V2F4W6_9FLAO|nr:16S rRNA (uracil(1498)-N(3))-methyltransferase [Aquimarina brevivitae]RZS90749.1 16S rRNA (uracil1498-N3)-methyltransferase [Aquimarina brevivitae]